jgi:hypothetical protein
VSQASYQTSDCASCGTSYQSTTSTSTPDSAYAPPQQQQQSQPELAPNESPPAERTFRKEETPDVTPDPYAVPDDESDLQDSGSATYFEAPQLFNPSDRSAARPATPVWQAVYHKPVDERTVATQPVTWQQAQQDAAGWTSASE